MRASFRTRDPLPIWKWVLDFLRELQVGEEFNIIDLYKDVDLNEKDRARSINKYRLLLIKCGYIECSKDTKFKKLKPIPLMTAKLAKDKADSLTWRSWFLEEVDPK